MNQTELIYRDLVDRTEKALGLPSGGLEDWLNRRDMTSMRIGYPMEKEKVNAPEETRPTTESI